MPQKSEPDFDGLKKMLIFALKINVFKDGIF